MIGKTVGKYRIVERLGRGGMGTVYKAIDETLDREVAIKVLNADLGDTDILKRFRAEAVTLARLNHPGIATLYELYRDDNDLLMVMEFVRGETVHELSERLGALAAPQAAHLAMQVLDALSHAHRAGVVHRDLKPANLMVTEMGIVKVMDFGIARVLGTEHYTQGGYMMGTPAYMAPEQVLGGEIDGRADLYAVGVVLYRLLSGQLPFSADTAIAMVQKQVNESPTPITQFQPDLPLWCARVLNRALAKSPGDRFQTADEFRTALLSAVQPQTLGEMPTMATPTPLGLQLVGDQTVAQQWSGVASEGYSQRTSAAAVATPLATSVPGAVPLPPPATSPPASPAAASPRPAAGSTTTVMLGRNQVVGLGAIVLAARRWRSCLRALRAQAIDLSAAAADRRPAVGGVEERVRCFWSQTARYISRSGRLSRRSRATRRAGSTDTADRSGRAKTRDRSHRHIDSSRGGQDSWTWDGGSTGRAWNDAARSAGGSRRARRARIESSIARRRDTGGLRHHRGSRPLRPSRLPRPDRRHLRRL